MHSAPGETGAEPTEEWSLGAREEEERARATVYCPWDEARTKGVTGFSARPAADLCLKENCQQVTGFARGFVRESAQRGRASRGHGQDHDDHHQTNENHHQSGCGKDLGGSRTHVQRIAARRTG
jgi:imidazoleglycerol phosphate dehydratase HisB